MGNRISGTVCYQSVPNTPSYYGVSSLTRGLLHIVWTRLCQHFEPYTISSAMYTGFDPGNAIWLYTYAHLPLLPLRLNLLALLTAAYSVVFDMEQRKENARDLLNCANLLTAFSHPRMWLSHFWIISSSTFTAGSHHFQPLPHLCLLWCLPSFVQEMVNSAIQYKCIMMPELVPQEIIRWKLRYENLPPDKRTSTVASAIKECDPLYFPNIRVLLKIACTIPVTSCECEWSASKLRRLHTYMHASMAQERLTSLALLHQYEKA